MTRLAEILPIWQYFKSLSIFECLFTIEQNFEPTLAKVLCDIENRFMAVKLASHLVTLIGTSPITPNTHKLYLRKMLPTEMLLP